MILAMAEEKQFHACYMLEGAERSSEEDVLELDSVLKKRAGRSCVPVRDFGVEKSYSE